MFSKKATKIEEMFTVDLTLTSKIDGEDLLNFCDRFRKHELYLIKIDYTSHNYTQYMDVPHIYDPYHNLAFQQKSYNNYYFLYDKHLNFCSRFILVVATDIIPWYSYWPKNMGLKTFERFIGNFVSYRLFDFTKYLVTRGAPSTRGAQ